MKASDLRPARDFAVRYGVKAVIYGPPGCGKCLAPGTPILMFDGSIKSVESVKIGDLLMGPDSLPRRVTHLAHGYDEMFNVIPTKGMTYKVNKPHIISLKKTNGNDTWISNISIENYLKTSKDFKFHFKGWRTGIQFPNKNIEIHPYLLGIWLGDGSSDELAFHTTDKEIVSFLQDQSLMNSLLLREYKYEKKCPRYRFSAGIKGKKNLLKEKFKKYNLFNNKHIPFDYKVNSQYVRLQLLAGLIDSDGIVTGKQIGRAHV